MVIKPMEVFLYYCIVMFLAGIVIQLYISIIHVGRLLVSRDYFVHRKQIKYIGQGRSNCTSDSISSSKMDASSCFNFGVIGS